MPRQAKITVLPSAEHPDYLTIQDAMLQIAEAFTLLKGDAGDDFDWKLVSASTNSPLETVGELVPKQPMPGSMLYAAETKVQESYQALSDVLLGEEPTVDFDEAVLRRILSRNTNGVGFTKISLDDFEPVEITPTKAEAALSLFKPHDPPAAPKRVRGTLEGELIDAGTYRRQPALKLRHRGRGNRIFWCRIPDDRRDLFAEATSLSDVWRNARVRLRGWIEYSKRGEIAGMSAEGIQHVRPRDVRFSDIVDPNFTGGLDSITYLDRLRDGEIGG